ncbi:MAG TPA: MarR family transcriptional regulator [Candidatus Dormibacteraeota bacterium]|nr:MarR family transcriptional regulator [Candidatus Dormibacteraeota bacterium]
MKSIHNVSSLEAARAAGLERLWGLAILLSDGMQAGLAERGLTLARAALLWQLQQDGASTQHSLSRALRVTPRNITGLVDALEAAGLVARTAHPSDRRATLVTLTDKGTAAARGMRRDQDRFAQVLFNDVTPAELATFVKVVDRVLARIRKTIPEADLQTYSDKASKAL